MPTHMHTRVHMPSQKKPQSNQIKSLLLSHHHSTSALVSEILMSVLIRIIMKPHDNTSIKNLV